MAGMMRRLFLGFAVAATGCSPSLNWRDVRIEDSPFVSMLACKPDRAVREVALVGSSVPLRAVGCDAGGATMAVLVAQLPAGVSAVDALEHWRRASLAHLRPQQVVPLTLTSGAGAGTRPVLTAALRVDGQRPDGSALQGRLVWLAAMVGGKAYLIHLVVYTAPGDRNADEIVETMVNGVRVQ